MNQKKMLQTIFSETKQSFVLSLPLMASNLVRSASGFVGTLMVAHLGKTTLDGMALGSSVFFTLVVFFFGILNSVSVLVSQHYGAENHEGVRKAVSQGFVLAILVSVPMYFIIFISPFVFRFTHESPEIIHWATVYLRTISIAILPFSFLIVMNQFLVGMSKTRVVLLINLVQVPFEILFTYVFVYGRFGIPKFGVAGVGYAFAIVFTLAAICNGVYINKSRYRSFNIFANFGKISSDYLIELIKIGWPIGCLSVIEVALFATVTFFMGELGSDPLAAYQILSQYIGPSIMIIFALSQVATIRVGQAVGRSDRAAVKRAAYVNMLLGAIFMIAVWSVFIGFSKQWIGLDVNVADSKNNELVRYAIFFFIFGGVSQFIDCFRFITIGALRGLKDTKKPMRISLIAFWLIAFPCAYIFTFMFHWGAAGCCYGILIGVISGLVLQLRQLKTLLDHADLKKIYTISG